jgi:hypothetical protein
MEPKHYLMFCPECGAKLDGQEDFCPNCGYKLVGEGAMVTPPAAEPPKVEQPPAVPPPPPVTTPEPTKPVEQAPVVTPEPPKPQPQPVQQAATVSAPVPKKKMSTGILVLIIVGAVIVLGGGTVGALWYMGKIDFDKLLGKQKTTTVTPVEKIHTGYYLCRSTGKVDGKNCFVVSNIIVSTVKGNNKQAAENLYKTAVLKKYPKDYFKIVGTSVYPSLKEAQDAFKKMTDDYTRKGFMLRTVDVKY